MTALHTVKSNGERAAHLVADQADILVELGLADIEARYPRHITLVHTRDSYSEKDVTRALCLVPTGEEPGINMESMMQATLCQRGTFIEVPLPLTTLPISKKFDQEARRTLANDW